MQEPVMAYLVVVVDDDDVISLSLCFLFQIACSTSTRPGPLGCLKLLLLCTAGRKEPFS